MIGHRIQMVKKLNIFIYFDFRIKNIKQVKLYTINKNKKIQLDFIDVHMDFSIHLDVDLVNYISVMVNVIIRMLQKDLKHILLWLQLRAQLLN